MKRIPRNAKNGDGPATEAQAPDWLIVSPVPGTAGALQATATREGGALPTK